VILNYLLIKKIGTFSSGPEPKRENARPLKKRRNADTKQRPESEQKNAGAPPSRIVLCRGVAGDFFARKRARLAIPPPAPPKRDQKTP